MGDTDIVYSRETMETVTVLMSSYNGEKYIKEQIDSILEQQNVNVELYIRDDGSTDSTIKILEEYSAKYENVSYYVGDNKGSCGSFFELLSKTYGSNYYALADQDDVWDKDKLSIAISKIKKEPNGIPILYYSNLHIVDEKLQYIRESHVKPMIAGAKYSYLSDVFVTGCTAVFNKELQDIAFKIKPTDFSMHDTWLYMVASMFGKCIYDFDSHINYRQHGNNVVGTRKKRISCESLKRELKNYFDWENQPRLNCAEEIRREFGDMVDSETLAKLDEFIHYKDSMLSTFKLAFDKELDSENLYRKIRFKITVLLRNA